MENIKTLELIKTFNAETLAEKLNNYDYIINMIDNGNITSNQFDEVQDFIINCVNDNDNIINNYYIYNYNFTPKAYDIIYNLAYNDCTFKTLYKTIYANNITSNDDIKKYMYNVLKNSIKGLRDTTPLHKLIGEYLKVNFASNDDVAKYVEMFSPKENKYILYIGNTPLAQLTASYSSNYSSCYNLERGEYRASNIFLMNDFKNYIVKIFDYNDNTLNMVENDTLKYDSCVISRFNLWIDKDNKYLISAKNYGDTSYYSNSPSNRKKLVNEITDILYNFTSNFNDDYHCNINYCNDFVGYRDYSCSFRFCSNNLTNDVFITIGASNLITWYIDKSDMIINNGYMYCSDCGSEEDEDDLYYCEDTCDYRCCSCCWYCDYDECYYSNNISYVEIPSGEKYKYDDCYFNN